MLQGPASASTTGAAVLRTEDEFAGLAQCRILEGEPALQEEGAPESNTDGDDDPAAPGTIAASAGANTLEGGDAPRRIRSKKMHGHKSTAGEKKEPHAVRLVPCVDHSAVTPLHYVRPIERRLCKDGVIRLGRVESVVPGNEQMVPIVFKSKVVSRIHAELSLEHGLWYVRDVQSSSGTFLNNTRLSQPNKVSPKCKVENGDVLQLGLNFRGGTEEVFQCVKMRIELDYSWRRHISEYNVESLRKLREQFSHLSTETELQECSICLMPLMPAQPLFVSPCSHGWHYRCIRPLLVRTYPHFGCPNCRGNFDLEEEED